MSKQYSKWEIPSTEAKAPQVAPYLGNVFISYNKQSEKRKKGSVKLNSGVLVPMTKIRYNVCRGGGGRGGGIMYRINTNIIHYARIKGFKEMFVNRHSSYMYSYVIQ